VSTSPNRDSEVLKRRIATLVDDGYDPQFLSVLTRGQSALAWQEKSDAGEAADHVLRLEARVLILTGMLARHRDTLMRVPLEQGLKRRMLTTLSNAVGLTEDLASPAPFMVVKLGEDRTRDDVEREAKLTLDRHFGPRPSSTPVLEQLEAAGNREELRVAVASMRAAATNNFLEGVTVALLATKELATRVSSAIGEVSVDEAVDAIKREVLVEIDKAFGR